MTRGIPLAKSTIEYHPTSLSSRPRPLQNECLELNIIRRGKRAQTVELDGVDSCTCQNPHDGVAHL